MAALPPSIPSLFQSRRGKGTLQLSWLPLTTFLETLPRGLCCIFDHNSVTWPLLASEAAEKFKTINVRRAHCCLK